MSDLSISVLSTGQASEHVAQCYEPNFPIAIYILNGWVDNGNRSSGRKILNKELLKSLKIKRCDAVLLKQI